MSTPRCLLRLLGRNKIITNFNRVKYLVLDEADILFLKYLPEMKEILLQCNQALKKRKGKACRMQILAAAQKWCPALESLARNVPKQPTICIASCLEAAVYAHLQPTLHFVEEGNRKSAVEGILQKQQGMFKTVVACQTAAEVQELAAVLMSSCNSLP